MPDVRERPGSHDESRAEKLDRELDELLQELRVVLPGVEILFAFLLAVPFTERFTHLTSGQRAAFFVGFIASAFASVCLLTPGAYHRIRFRQRDKEKLLRTANTLTIAGLGFLAIATGAVVWTVSSFVYPGPVGPVATGAVMAGIVLFWCVLPLARRVGDD